MIVAKIRVSGANAETVWANAITERAVGAQIRIEYGPEWEGLTKTVVFRGAANKDVITDATDVDIPAECAAVAGVPLKVGIYGIRGQELAIPTLWVRLGRVQRSADPSGDTATDPSLPVWAQIRAMIGDLGKLDTKAKSDLVAAVNEALKRGGGTVDSETVKQIVADYLVENPPEKGEKGDTGPQGPQGEKGDAGKTAYQYAVDGGYTGTEEAFAAKLAQKQLSGNTAELTPTQVYHAVSAGIPVNVQYLDSTYGLLSFTAFNFAETLYTIVSQAIVYYNGVYILAELFGDRASNTWGFMSTTLAEKTDIPTDDHINSLIDTKLGVIENGAY